MAVSGSKDRLIIIKTGDTFGEISDVHGDFEQWIQDRLGAPDQINPLRIVVIDPRANEPLPEPEDILAAVITGSHAMVTENTPWMEAVSHWIRRSHQQKCPLLGICFGHQLIAQALGGEVAAHPNGAEVGTIKVVLQPEAYVDPLFSRLPPVFNAQSVHWQSVRRLPVGAHLLASSSVEAHHGFRLGECTWGVQFHPEFTPAVMGGYIEASYKELEEQGKEPERLISHIQPTPFAHQLLQDFVAYARYILASPTVNAKTGTAAV